MHMINKAKAQGFIFEKKHKDINWAFFAEWTIQKKLRKF